MPKAAKLKAMGFHGHHHGHSHDHSHDIPRALTKALLVTVFFMLVEAVGGYYANSLALLGDAAHMLTDVGAILLSLFAYWVSRRPSTPTMSFGYHRAEILGALASGLGIWFIAGLLVYEAVERLSTPPEVQGPIVFFVATVGLVANLASMKMLHSSKDESINVRAAYLHLLADSLGSVGAVVAGAVLWLTDWRLIDPILTIVFAAMMIVGSWQLVKESVGVLMESTPAGVNPERVKQDLDALEEVISSHDLHIWSVSSGRLALSVHLIANETQLALNRAQAMLKERYGIDHTTIQVEHPEEFANSDHCHNCASG